MKTIILALCFNLSLHLLATLPTISESKEEHGSPVESPTAEKNFQTKPQGNDATLENYLIYILERPMALPQRNPAITKIKGDKFFLTKLRVLHTQLMVLSTKLHTSHWVFASEHSNVILTKKDHRKLIEAHIFYLDRYLKKVDP